MSELGLKSLVRPKRYCSYKGQVGKVAKNILNRDFKASHPNEKWVTDITEFNVKGKKLYLSVLLDLYNSEVVSHEIAERPHLEMVDSMLSKAIKILNPKDKPMLHSDQGWQYQMTFFQQRLRDNGITQSMSRSGNCLDNAVMENFFGILKTELFYLEKFNDIKQLANYINSYIYYYNHDRIKLKLGGLSPIKYRLNREVNISK
ncbi:transposase [Gilliamella sp. Occ3-1]|nr:transposase [Gilliamella apicola]